MHRVGRIALWAGFSFSLIGLFGGFGAMFIDVSSRAVNLLALVPLGFILLMLGVVMTQMSRPERPDPMWSDGSR